MNIPLNFSLRYSLLRKIEQEAAARGWKRSRYIQAALRHGCGTYSTDPTPPPGYDPSVGISVCIGIDEHRAISDTARKSGASTTSGYVRACIRSYIKHEADKQFERELIQYKIDNPKPEAEPEPAPEPAPEPDHTPEQSTSVMDKLSVRHDYARSDPVAAG